MASSTSSCAHLLDRTVLALDRARATHRRLIAWVLRPDLRVLRDVARTRLARGGDNFLLSDGQALLVGRALDSNRGGARVLAVRRLVGTGEIRPGAVQEIRREIDHVIDSVVAGGDALWEFGALRALEIYFRHHGVRAPVPGWADS